MILGLKIYSMHQKSCINALFTKIVMWKSLMHTQVFYVLRIIGKMLSPAVPLMIKEWKQSVLPPDLKELSKLFFFLFPNSINSVTPSDHYNIQWKTEGKANALHTTLFTVGICPGFADCMELCAYNEYCGASVQILTLNYHVHSFSWYLKQWCELFIYAGKRICL